MVGWHGRSAAAYRDDQFQCVTVRNLYAGVGATRHDVAVALECDTLACIAQLSDECGDIEVGGELSADAVDVDSDHFSLYSVQ